MSNKEFDWSTVDKKWKYMATDEDGCTFLYEIKPFRVDTSWSNNKGDYELVTITNWKETLIERPKEKAEPRIVGCALTDSQLKELGEIINKMEAENKE